ncbi:MAG TPA: VOC family protein [Desulfovibrio sp.]|jgi:hypothetical protein|uniref:VOC family protein n=1 Tax=Desulfovibrio sp. TaxID=885 RepID=UPI002B95E7FC|nr:VOC family protein [Desulfovibrio sp.]HMM39550.1 VOC family protein [Desulfovibrio sp.]
MPLELDHIFVCCGPGAPEAETLIRLGLAEGPSNTHPGQGTANRRFPFGNAYLELLWVTDPAEAQAGPARETRLWERWSRRRNGANPFGFVFRSRGAPDGPAPCPTRAYRPAYLPPGLVMEFADGAPLEEPEIVFLPFVHGPGRVAPPKGGPVRGLIRVEADLPRADHLSEPSRALAEAGLMVYRRSPEHLLELVLDADAAFAADLRPGLPLLLRGGPAR